MPEATYLQPTPYNPLDKQNLGKSVAEALLESALQNLPPAERFLGAGVYAIYYTGDFAAYAPLVAAGWPIYVGKAIPSGGRKGSRRDEASRETPLWKRLDEHAKSIRQVSNLRIEDFRCKYLIVDDIFISLGERLLIDTFRPIWNRAIDGFGNHDPGSGRYKGERPRWDVLHPGRAWAARLAVTRTLDQIEQELTTFMEAGAEPLGVADSTEEADDSGV